MLGKSFQEVLYRIDNWINEGSGWKIESINGEYVNISFYSPLMGSTYIELPDKLKNPMMVSFRHLNLVKAHPERITKEDREMINDLDYEGIEFLVSKEDYGKIEIQNNICIKVLLWKWIDLSCLFIRSKI